MATKFRTELTAERARHLFSYDPITGLLAWNNPTANCLKVGDKAGCPSGTKRDHLQARVDGHLLFVHRVIWLMVHGTWPANIVDHLDNNGLNNVLSNLRECTTSANAHNRCVGLNNSSGILGVCQFSTGKWRARIHVRGKLKHLGLFSTIEEAASARKAAELIYYPTKPQVQRGA